MIRFYTSILIIILGFFSPKSQIPIKKFKVGLSVCTTSDTWKKTSIELMQNELRYSPDIQLFIKDARNNCELQKVHIEEFLDEKIDLLIVSPNLMSSINASIEKALENGIPVMLIDRKITDANYTSYVGGDNYKIGFEAGEYAARLLNQKGNIIEIKGREGVSPTIQRNKGFNDAISKYPEMNIVFTEFGNWNEEGAKDAIQRVISQKLDFDLVFAYNDLMAKESYRILKNNNLNKKYFIIGIDGLPGNSGGIQAVINGQIDATFYYPPHGDKIIQVANNILHKLPFEKDNFIEAVPVDSSNAEDLNSQYRQVQELQEKIDLQNQALNYEMSKNKTLNLILLFSLILLVLVSTLIIFIYSANRNKKKANELLETKKDTILEKNQSITYQQKELLLVTQKLEEATNSKLAFFSNISHEFKTPLTLITGPLEFLIKSKSFAFEDEQQLRLMYRNSLRLLRLVNQLIDFEKFENNQMKLSVSECDFKEFLREKEETFRYLAKSKSIDFKFISDVSEISLWIDHDKLDKVFFNLLSNAFKFTPDFGKIEIVLRRPQPSYNKIYEQEIQIEIKDSGEGIEEKQLKRIFEQYFQSKKSHGNFGTGLGLSLSKRFVEMHRGSISVESTVGKGTNFFVRLPLGNKHFKMEELVESNLNNNFVLGPPSLLNTRKEKIISNAQDFNYKPLILIVDDELDVRKYIKYCLSSEYEIIEAVNGKEAIKMAQENEPDLIICDIIMPNMNGIETVKSVKEDIKISHIPIILLTAKDSIENEIEGLQEGAESYISKPFDQRYLLSNIRNILEQRKRLREFYKCNLDFHKEDGNLSRLDRNFMSNIGSIVNDEEYKNGTTVELISEKIGISRVHLYRKIKKLTGMSVSEYITSIKLKNSINLLTNSDKSVSDIAYEVGFSSASYYTKCFKKQFNQSPTLYRKIN